MQPLGVDANESLREGAVIHTNQDGHTNFLTLQ